MGFQLRQFHAPDFTQERFLRAPEAKLVEAPCDHAAPSNYHAMSIFPEYFKIKGEWLLAEESRMDCVAVYEGGKIHVREFRMLKKGDLVVTGRAEDGSEGIYVHPDGFNEGGGNGPEVFAFRQGRSRETGFSKDYQELVELLKHDRDHGKIVWVAGPALCFNGGAREAVGKLVANGYVHTLMAGNALATHDLEGGWLHTALGQDIHTTQNVPLGHYNHLDTINRVRQCGSIPAFLEAEGVNTGIIYNCVKKNVPFVLCGSIRDDGPLPEVIADVYAGQNRMRDEIRGATTVICLATMLHSIAVGNMTPSYRVMPDGTVRQIYFYCVDTAEFTVNKLSDRGSLSAKGIVTNVQDFVIGLSRSLGL